MKAIGTDDILDRIQMDTHELLRGVPALADACHIVNDAGDLEATLLQKLSTLDATTGKAGLAVITLMPSVTSAEPNLPGPQMIIQQSVEVLEQVLINRDETTGTGVRSSTAALAALNALHLQTIGLFTWIADKDPIEPLPMARAGFVSHAVRLSIRLSLTANDKPLMPTAAVGAVPNFLETSFGASNEDNDLRFTQVSSGAAPTIRFIGQQGAADSLVVTGNAIVVTFGTNFGAAFTPPQDVIGWFEASEAASALVTCTLKPGDTGANSIMANFEFGPTALSGGHPTIILSCATNGAQIYYTTDGSLPRPDGDTSTLYEAPVAMPEAGTLVRAGAYVTGKNPSDILELTVTP
jgi:hypothetical protein